MLSDSADYDIIASYYDDVLGTDPNKGILKKHLQKNYKKNSSVLDLGCGTGTVLKSLSSYFKTEGLDVSGKMLEMAKKKLPHAKFYRQDITRFTTAKKYDIVLCLYDTINHIKGIKNWKNIFRNVCSHLNEKGTFIFDINTISKLKFLSEEPPFVINFKKNYLIMDVSKSGRNYTWSMKVFQHIKNNRFKLTENKIEEYSFEASKIKMELLKYFSSVKVLNSEFNPAGKDPFRLYFICN